MPRAAVFPALLGGGGGGYSADSGAEAEGRAILCTQRLQYPLFEEYSLNHIRDPILEFKVYIP